MKKVMLMVAFMVATVAASAQVYIGGGFGINSSKPAQPENANIDATTTISIIPEIGYKLSDKWTVGLGIGYTHTSNPSSDQVLGYEGVDKLNGFVIAPYARYHFVKWNKVGLFIQGGLSYTSMKGTAEADDENGWESDVDGTVSTFYIGFKPGIQVDLSEKLSLVATVGNLGWSTSSYGGDVWEDYDASSTFDFGVDLSQINFAMYYNF